MLLRIRSKLETLVCREILRRLDRLIFSDNQNLTTRVQTNLLIESGCTFICNYKANITVQAVLRPLYYITNSKDFSIKQMRLSVMNLILLT